MYINGDGTERNDKLQVPSLSFHHQKTANKVHRVFFAGFIHSYKLEKSENQLVSD